MARPAGAGEQTKKRIALKAKSLFEQKGYSATTMDEIVTIAGTSKGSIYYHFKSKEELFLYILELTTEEWLDKWARSSEPLHTATEKLYTLAELFATDFQNPLMRAAEEFAGSESADPDIHAKLLEMTRMHYPILRQLLEEGMSSGEFEPMETTELMYIVLGLLGGLGVAYYDLSSERILPLYRRSIDILLRGIRKK
ncbi:AcrR family transcriptional regulator [Paenibacillus phyllosphaerae]|uniref:AcrR family transcriptional regulator n=1 Tax=Paenibacillus phyllosphaerae TaxID=274593 RepID=A0A7W5B1H3_9BACL|nr:TetR/AcrR family transcriptional regulator [Paenibacillus phyllosphaerae]MBB3112389.1 AcrR family transcriptional regulator [Paenibacillus phyllosphaerae]